jgi:hypothetical protein
MPHTRTVALALALAACGGGDKKNPTPDASPPAVDAAPDARTCSSSQVMNTDFYTFDADTPVLIFHADGGDPGDGNPVTVSVELYGGVEASLMGTFDLTQGNQANYSTCAVCVRAYSQDADGNLIKEFFQSGGSVTISQDPLADQHLVATFTDLQLQEVTVDRDGGTFASTPVANGLCTSYGSPMIDHDKVPNAWTCAHTAYQDGNCDCACGMIDTDCDGTSTQTVNGCTVDQPVCSSGVCAAAVANDTCTGAVTLTLGTAVQGTTVGAYADYNNGLEGDACATVAEAGPDVAYMVHLTAGTAYTVTLSGVDPNFDAGVALLGPGAASICAADPIATCVAGADAGFEGDPETFTYTPATTGDYYVLVDSYYPFETGAFTLKVE